MIADMIYAPKPADSFLGSMAGLQFIKVDFCGESEKLISGCRTASTEPR